jgi:hypothetical protein
MVKKISRDTHAGRPVRNKTLNVSSLSFGTKYSLDVSMVVNKPIYLVF